MLKKISFKPILAPLAFINFLCFTEDIIFILFALSMDAAIIYYKIKVDQIEKEWRYKDV